MISLLNFNIFAEIEKVFLTIGQNVSLSVWFYIFVGFEVFFILYFMIKSRFAYEHRLLRSCDKLNVYLLNNSYITENNLIEFNKKMKRVPKVLRYYWQQFMLFREETPSFYMSSNNCIEKPLKSSSLKYNIKVISIVTVFASILSFVLSMFSAVYTSIASDALCIAVSLIIPSIIVTLFSVYIVFQRLRNSVSLADLYQTFHIFQRLLNKATTTLPSYVDFEVLFTKKEIKKGIPVLNEYLEKRARQEQEELEKARVNAVQHETYDFGDVDINGELILERALKETEVYLSIRNRLLAEIQQIESEMDSLKKTNDNTQKDYQRKLQASKENIDRLRLQQESTTNRIESNYIRQQQSAEIKKQQQIEKENDEATLRFNKETSSLVDEIQKRKNELEEKRMYVENVMKSEYKSYATKIYKNVKKLADKNQVQEKQKLIQEKEELNYVVLDLKEQLEEFQSENFQIKSKLGDKIEISTNKKESKKAKEPEYDEYGGYYDAEGYYRYRNGTYYDPDGNYHDENGGYYDADGKYYPPQNTEVEEPIVLNEQEVELPPEIINLPDFNQSSEAHRDDESAKEVEIKDNSTEPKNAEKKVEGLYKEPKSKASKKPESDEGDEGKVMNLQEPVKKRGRPRKEKSIEEVKKPKGKPGRPRKIKTDEELNKPKGKRGRPRKEKSIEELNKPKGKRGRPRKVQVEPKPQDDLKLIEKKIEKENNNLSEKENELNSEIHNALKQLYDSETDDVKLLEGINDVKLLNSTEPTQQENNDNDTDKK